MNKNEISKIFLLSVILVMYMFGCKDKENILVEVKAITLDKTELTLFEGESVALAATVSPEEAEKKH
jgi:Bacterial surface proteins containing Ig-like domains